MSGTSQSPIESVLVGELYPPSIEKEEADKRKAGELLQETVSFLEGSEKVGEAQKERSEELLSAWIAHTQAAPYAHSLRCPICGEQSLEYDCCGLSLEEAQKLSARAYEDHLHGQHELENEDVVESDWRDYEGKEQAPSFQDIVEGEH